MYKYVGFLNVQNLPRLYVDLFHSLRIKYKCIEELLSPHLFFF